MAFALASFLLVLGCGGGSTSSSSSSSASYQCSSTVTGTPWSPSVTGLSANNHDSNVVLSQTVYQKTGAVTGLAQGTSSREISFTIDMSQDLGAYGSLTLMAQVAKYPSGLQGSAFAFLTSLNDGTNEYVNLSSACGSSGFYQCSNGSCSINTSCAPSWPSAFLNRNQYEQYQGDAISAANYPSVNIFPTCNWSGGTNGSTTNPSCAFNQTFFPSGYSPPRLRYGVNYTAKYVLVADSYSTLSGYQAGINLTVVKKTSNHGSVGGTVDFNVVLVGNTNVQASRTAKGQQNLNTLVSNLMTFYGQSNSSIKFGTVRAVEWPCQTGGDQYSSMVTSELGNMFVSAKNILPSGLDTTAMNVFLVGTITDDSASANSNLTILGIDGAIGGPAMNGTAISGVAVSSFNTLDTYNSSCPSSSGICALNQQDSSFYELSETVAHEMGHYFRLNHPSESSGTIHDDIPDTPACTATQSISGVNYITINSCLNSDSNIFSGTNSTCSANCGSYSTANGTFCPTATACEFNYIMWWTVKNFYQGNSDGELFSPDEAVVMSYHPLIQ